MNNLPIKFLTTAMTLSKIRNLVLNEERMIVELLETRSQLAKYTGESELKSAEPSPPRPVGQ